MKGRPPTPLLGNGSENPEMGPPRFIKVSLTSPGNWLDGGGRSGRT